MKKDANFIKRIGALLLFVAGCNGPDQEIVPQQNCDTLATVRVQACGLALELKDKQLLMPVNAVLVGGTQANDQQYRVNNFTVKAGQQVIVGFMPQGGVTDACNGQPAQKIQVTCIVGYQALPATRAN